MVNFKRTPEERQRIAELLRRRKVKLNDEGWIPPNQKQKICGAARLSIHYGRKHRRDKAKQNKTE